jgi:hypothetical protein
LNIGLSNMASAAAPKVLLGSVFEVNGGLYKVDADESVGGSPAQGQNYIYAVPNTDGASFQYSATKPVWDGAKGGWYHSSSDPGLQGARAVAKVYCDGTNYNNKVLLDTYKAMAEINKLQPLPTSGGTQVVTGTVNEVKTATLEPGYYRYELKAGSGGNGGNGGNTDILGGDHYAGGTGGNGADGESLNKSFSVTTLKTISYGLGGDGNNGGDGVDSSISPASAATSGGGGCSGGYSFIDYDIVCGGSGGGGGAAGINLTIPDNSGGGGYGIGDDGGNGSSGKVGGIGGANSRGGKDKILPGFVSGSLIFYMYARGGDNENNTAGGDNLKSTSSGYLRIYRVG